MIGHDDEFVEPNRRESGRKRVPRFLYNATGATEFNASAADSAEKGDFVVRANRDEIKSGSGVVEVLQPD
jgi:hypothetical protein